LEAYGAVQDELMVSSQLNAVLNSPNVLFYTAFMVVTVARQEYCFVTVFSKHYVKPIVFKFCP